MKLDTDNRPIEQLRRFYTKQYSDEQITSFCPPGTNSSLVRRGRAAIDALPDGATVLDLGAGAFYFTGLLQSSYKLNGIDFPNKRIVSVELVPVTKKPHLKTDAIQADGAYLPFQDNVIDLAVSNMAMDFMGDKAGADLLRVLRPGASAHINLMQLDMLPTKLEAMEPSTLSVRQRDTYDSCLYLKENNVLFEDPELLSEKYRKLGFQVASLSQGTSGGRDKWWEVELIKPLTEM